MSELNWEPPCSVEDATDEQLKASPIYERVRNIGGIVLPDESALPIVKEMWAKAQEALEQERYSDSILALFALLDTNDVEHDGEIIIRRVAVNEDDEDSDHIGRYKVPRKKGSRSRFKLSDYAKLVGYGDDRESDTGKLSEHGGFVLKKTAMKNAERNGVYELCFDEGDPQNEVCPDFTARLYQRTDDGASHAVITFPPASGDKKKLVQDDKIFEVTSMSQMMKQSVLQHPQSPGVVFDLADKLKAIEEAENGTDDDAPETPEANEGESQAAALLDEDD